MNTRAALFTGERELEVRDVELDAPGPSDVVVRMQAVGVCGSDLHVVKGEWPRPTPMVLGHEGAGVVEHIGAGVSDVAVGQRVVAIWAPNCGACISCRRGTPTACVEARRAIGRGEMIDGRTGFSLDGEPVYRMTTVGAFAEHVLLPVTSVVPLPQDVNIEQAALLGCASLTGVGAVENAARVSPGDTVLVVGAGGVGLFAVQGARIAGASEILVIDTNAERLALASALGATACGAPDVLDDLVADRAPGGVDRAIEAVGHAETVELAIDATRPGGRIALVGLPQAGVQLEVDGFSLVAQQKTLIGSMSGSRDPRAQLERLFELVATGDLQLAPLLGGSFGLEQINEAVRASLAGAPGRVIVRPDVGAKQSNERSQS
jgi:alcohol dehydrogenase